MATFDAWEAAVHPPEDYLMHFRTKGSKNGVRRYQREDGTWTELGLEERREREGWGDSKAERKARKRVEKAERQLQRNETARAKKEAKAQRKFERAEKKRKKTLSGLTDEEMKAKLERAKMEAEYRDLTKKTSLIETGAKLVTKYLERKDIKEQRQLEANRQKVDMERAKADIVRAREGTKRAKAEAKKAKEERKQTEADVEGGLKIERKQKLVDAKREMKNYTIRGGIARRINMALTSGKAKEYESVRKARGDAEANKIRSENDSKYNQYRSDAARDLRNRQDAQARKDAADAQKRADKAASEAKRQAEREKAQRRKERERKAAAKSRQQTRDARKYGTDRYLNYP